MSGYDVVGLTPGAPTQVPAQPLSEVKFHKRAWLPSELRVLRTTFVEKGVEAALKQLPGRSRKSIFFRARQLGVRTKDAPTRVGVYRRVAAEALDLKQQGLSDREIGEQLGMCEAAASNAVFHGMCEAAGNTPIERGADGRITAEGRARIRRLLDRGLKHRDIQIECGVAAATITRERQLYEQELEEYALPALPPPGNGEAYSGVPVSAKARKQVEALFLEGFGTRKISARTGVSWTSCGRIRNALVDRLRQNEECLPGCDINGKRRGPFKESLHYVHPKQFEALERLLMEGWSVAAAAVYVGIGRSRADKHVHQRIAEGVIFPKPERRYRVAARIAEPLPRGRLSYFRQLLVDQSLEDAREAVFVAEYGRPPIDQGTGLS